MFVPASLSRDVLTYSASCSDWAFKHSFGRDIYCTVIDGMLSAKPPSYAEVLEFDRKIRQTTLPNVRLYLRPEEANYSNPSVVLKSFFLSHFRSISASRPEVHSTLTLLTL